jgi:hypothetical protein
MRPYSDYVVTCVKYIVQPDPALGIVVVLAGEWQLITRSRELLPHVLVTDEEGGRVTEQEGEERTDEGLAREADGQQGEVEERQGHGDPERECPDRGQDVLTGFTD